MSNLYFLISGITRTAPGPALSLFGSEQLHRFRSVHRLRTLSHPLGVQVRFTRTVLVASAHAVTSTDLRQFLRHINFYANSYANANFYANGLNAQNS